MLFLSFARLVCYQRRARPVSRPQMTMCWPPSPPIKSCDGCICPRTMNGQLDIFQDKRTLWIPPEHSWAHVRDYRRHFRSRSYQETVNNWQKMGAILGFTHSSIIFRLLQRHRRQTLLWDMHFKVLPYTVILLSFTPTNIQLTWVTFGLKSSSINVTRYYL